MNRQEMLDFEWWLTEHNIITDKFDNIDFSKISLEDAKVLMSDHLKIMDVAAKAADHQLGIKNGTEEERVDTKLINTIGRIGHFFDSATGEIQPHLQI